MIEWNIQARSHHCQTCGKPFVEKQAYHTLLSDDKKLLQRLDECWTGQHSQGATERKGFISHWQGIYVPPPAAPPDPIQKDTAETLLRKLVERSDPQYAGACYILAVMLERKRILKVKAQHQRDGQRVFVYEHAKTGDILTVPDPNLQFDQLEKVQHDIDHLLEHGLDGANAATPPPVPPEGTAVTVETTRSPDETVPPPAPVPA